MEPFAAATWSIEVAGAGEPIVSRLRTSVVAEKLLEPVDQGNDPLADSGLWVSFREGDDAALQTLMHRYERVIRGAMTARSVLWGEREDLTQETWIRAWEKRRQFRGSEQAPELNGYAFGTWLRRICVSVCAQQARHTKSAVRAAAFAAAEPLQNDPSGDESIVARDALEDALVSAVLTLPPRQRLAVVYRYLVGYDTAQTAKALNCRAGTVQSALYSAIHRLRRDVLVIMNTQD